MTSRALLFAVSLTCSTPLQAQFLVIPRTGHGSGWGFDVGGQIVRPVGEFQANVPLAWGVGGSVRYLVRPTPFALRIDMSWLNYGYESRRVPLSASVNRVTVDMRTSNNLALFTGGPELVMEFGPLQPYAVAFAGYSYFYTESAASGRNQEDFASSTNFSDGGLATGYGGGVRIPVHSHRYTVAIDAGARFTRAGTRSYLIKGDVQDQSDGTMVFTPRTTATDFWQAHLGATFSSRR